MSGDQNHKTGHEVDAIPSGRMFNLLVGLSLITLLSCIGLIQVFNSQRDSIGIQRAKQGSFLLNEYRQEMNEVSSGYGPTSEPGKFFMPLSKAKEAVSKDPSKLAAAPAPAGWVHPDDMQGGGQAAAPAAPPVELEPAGEGEALDAGMEGDTAGESDVPADGTAGEDDAPADDTPAAQPKPEPAKKPAAEPKPEPKPAKKPAAEPEPKPEPKPAKKPAAEPKPEPKPEPAKKPAAEPKPTPEPAKADEGGGN